MGKRLLSILLAVCMVLTLLPFSTFAAETEAKHVHSADCEHTHEVENEPQTPSADEAALPDDNGGDTETDGESLAADADAGLSAEPTSTESKATKGTAMRSTTDEIGYDAATIALINFARARLTYLSTKSSRSEVTDALSRLNGIKINQNTLSCSHTWSKSSTVAATCISAGYDVQTCSKCGMIQYVANGTTKLGHTSLSYCTRCGRRNLVQAGDFWISCDTPLSKGRDYKIDDANALRIYTLEHVTISNVDADVPIAGWIGLDRESDGVKAQEITLAGVQVYANSGVIFDALKINPDLLSVEIHIAENTTNYLFGNSKLKKGAAIYKQSIFTQLTIDGKGELFAIGAKDSGIGADSSSNITISDATVIAGSLEDGAGIGDDRWKRKSAGGSSGLTFDNTSVVAFGKEGIGAYYNSIENITIQNNSVVIAQGAEYGPGIGSTSKKLQGLTIKGSTVTALGGRCAPGIGSNSGDNIVAVENITINTSVVRAIGGMDEAVPGIGASSGDASMSGLAIQDSTVTALTSEQSNLSRVSPGIGASWNYQPGVSNGGGGCSGTLSNVVIENSSVKTNSSYRRSIGYAANIGYHTTPVSPVNSKGEKVALLVLPNPEGQTVYYGASSKAYTTFCKNHAVADTNDTNLYAYFPESVTEFQVGNGSAQHLHYADGKFEDFFRLRYDEDAHFQQCIYTGCTVTKDRAAHTFEGVICSTCGYGKELKAACYFVDPVEGTTSNMGGTQTVDWSTPISSILPTVPYYNGYEFVGWSNEQNGALISEGAVCGDYAVDYGVNNIWTELYTVWKPDELLITDEYGTVLNKGASSTTDPPDYAYVENTYEIYSAVATVRNNEGVTSTAKRISLKRESQNMRLTLAGVNIISQSYALIAEGRGNGQWGLDLKEDTVNTLVGAMDGSIISANSQITIAISGEGGLILGNTESNYGFAGNDFVVYINEGTITCNAKALAKSDSFVIINGGSVKAEVGSGVRPKNENGDDLYLLVISNPEAKEVTIDGVKYNGTNHTLLDPKDTNLYAWAPGRDCTVTVGGTVYKFEFVNGTFRKARDLTITSDETIVEGTDYTYSDAGVLTILTDKPVTIRNKDGVAVSKDVIAVGRNVNADITLAGVNIDVSFTGEQTYTTGIAAFSIADDSEGDVTLRLAEGTENTLKSGRERAGLEKNGSDAHISGADYIGRLTICGTGKLTAMGGFRAAGIGSSVNKRVDNITIEGGIIHAEGNSGAGIGSGMHMGDGCDNLAVDNIEIYGGTVTATGGSGAAGIGGGKNCGTNSINFLNCVAYVTAGSNAAAIGTGYSTGEQCPDFAGVGFVSSYVEAVSADSNAIGVGYAYNATSGGEFRGLGFENSTVILKGGTNAIGCGPTATIDATSMFALNSTLTFEAKYSGVYSRQKLETVSITGGSLRISCTDSNAVPFGYGESYDSLTPVIPWNDNENELYLITLPNPDGKDIYIDGVKWTPSNHTAADPDDTNLYAYVGGRKHMVTIGEESALWHFDASKKTFVKTDCFDNDGNCKCDLCDATLHHLVNHTAQAATCTGVGWEAYEACSQCDYTTYQEIPALGHDEQPHEAKAATCTEKGWNAYVTCSHCNYTTYQEIPALGHDEQNHEAKAATCTEVGWNAYVTCKNCNYTTYNEIPALGHDEQPHEAKAATCTEKGWNAYVTCSHCDYTTYQEIPALGHDEQPHEAKAATCTEVGWNAYVTCSRCDYTTYSEIPALGHDYQPVVTPPTCTAMGYTTHTCSHCGDSYQNSNTAMIDHDYKNGVCTVCGAEEVVPECPSKHFPDCTEQWYHEAIDFMTSHGLMYGMSQTRFGPQDTMTRAMMVTVLYRFAGSPAVSATTTFTDVETGRFYTNAVAWAQKANVVSGLTETEFGPDEPITREQAAAILWRYEDRPDASADLSSFHDSGSISNYAKQAMQWAVSKGIFSGDDKGNLNPTDHATRAEFAVIIMNYLDGSFHCPE